MGTNPQAIVTGAASGIGAAFARRAAAQSYDLLLIDRNAAGLAALAAELGAQPNRVVRTHVANLADRAELDGVIAALAGLARLDLLVNSAGVAEKGPFLEQDPDRLRNMIALHCTAPLLLCQAVLPRLVAQHGGSIINVAALGGGLIPFGVGPNYGATKAYAVRLTQALHQQFRREGVYFQAFCPGHTRTDIHDAEDRRFIPEIFFSDPETVVQASWSAMQRRRPAVCIPGLRHKLVWLLARLGVGKPIWFILLKLERVRGRQPAA